MTLALRLYFERSCRSSRDVAKMDRKIDTTTGYTFQSNNNANIRKCLYWSDHI